MEKEHGGLLPYVGFGFFGRIGVEELLMMLCNPTKQSNQLFCIP